MEWLYLNHAFIKQENATLHISDLALQRGYGAFDYLKVVGEKPVFLEAHLQRLFYSAAQMRLPIEQTLPELKAIIFELIERNKAGTSGIRITLTGGYSSNGYTIAAPNLFIQQQPLKLPDMHDFQKGIRLVSYPHIRPLPHVKSINYIMGIWLQEHVKQHQADDVLYHWNGIISECPRANIFLVTDDNILVTPKSNILEGITRKHILALSGSVIQNDVRDISLETLYQCKEAFITSSTKQILPVVSIDGRLINEGKPGSVSEKLLHILEQAQQEPASTGMAHI